MMFGNDVVMEELYVLPKFPIRMLAPAGTRVEEDRTLDMRFGIDKATGMIRVMELPSKEDVYSDPHSNAVGGVWEMHHKLVAGIVVSHSPKSVLEIGGGGKIASICVERITHLRWVMLEPNPGDVCAGVEVVRGFFPEDVPKDVSFDMIVHTHVMEHMEDPEKFVKLLGEKLPPMGHMVFSVPNLKALLQNGATSVLNFEHTMLLCEDHVEYLLEKYGFAIYKKEYYKDHSIIYSVVKSGLYHDTPADFSDLCRQNKELFRIYIENHRSKIGKLNEKIEQATSPLYLFGAHITTQFYLAFGMRRDKIKGILDNDSKKWGKRVSGTSWDITSPEILRNIKTPTVILPMGPYTSEIKNQLENQINANTTFIEISSL